MAHERVNAFYRGVLESFGFDVTEDGFIKINLPPHTVPLTVKDYPLVLPSTENLRNPLKKTIFHPLREDMIGGESEVLQEIRKAVSLRINLLVTNIGTDLLNAAAASDVQKRIVADQSSLITSLGDVDQDIVKKFVQLSLAGAKKDPSKSFVGMYGKRAPIINGKNYKRGCIVFFPIYADLVNGDDKIFGVKITAKQREAFLRLYQFLFPSVEDQDHYSAGSNSKIAPFFESFIRSALLLLESLSSIVSVFGNLTETRVDLKNTEWIDEIPKLESMLKDILMIPVTGGITEETQEGDPAPAVATAVPMPAARVPFSNSNQVQQYPGTTMPQAPMGHAPMPPVNAVPPAGPPISGLGALINRNPQMAQAMHQNQIGYQSGPVVGGRPPPTWAMPGSPTSPSVGLAPMQNMQGPQSSYYPMNTQPMGTTAQLDAMLFNNNQGPPF